MIENNNSFAQQIPYEKDKHKNTTSTYEELTSFYTALLKAHKEAKLVNLGPSDVGKPLQLIILSKDGDFDPVSIKKKGKAVLFMNNGIHPGEPEGMDAMQMFCRDLLVHHRLPENVVICIIPVYNIAGMLNRGVSRVNQNGPDAYGFRGSRENYDLNRDFIKGDTRNSRIFQQVFTTWDPDVFFDTHTSNGADYQYVMTLIATQKDKLHPDLSSYMTNQFTDKMYEEMEKVGYPMIPYVDSKGETPESGLVAFLESPRYSTGYAALNHTIGYMPETHMWKSYEDRVKSTYHLMDILLKLTEKEAKQIVNLRKSIKEKVIHQAQFDIKWKLNEDSYASINFLGFESGHKASDISGKDRLFYDRTKPYQKKVPYFNTYTPILSIEKPKAYIIPQAYDRVIQLLQLNGVKMKQLEQDHILDVEMYSIKSFKTATNPYEGHYPHADVNLQAIKMKRQFYTGDWIIEMNQTANRYIIETLEPQATDSFFNWNFFDAILGQKEYFSSYIFEDEAFKYLQKNPTLKAELEQAKKDDPKLNDSANAQLDWIYKHSPYYEDTHMLYPVGRIK